MTPAAPPVPLSDASPAAGEARWFLAPEFLIRAGILLFAAALRFYDLELRPPHFDEGVNGWFTDQMQKNGFYAYDPTNYHGPLHFYVLFLFKCLFGRHVWALRLPVVLVGILTVDWMFRFDRFIGRTASAWAALALTVSPGLLYYQRDAIHETWQVYFLILAFWGVFGLWQDGAKRYLWATVMGVTGMILTKETYIIHFGCFLCAVPVLFVLEAFLPSRRTLLAEPPPPPSPTPEDEGRTLWADPPPPPPLFPRFAAAIAPQRYRDTDVIAALAAGFALIALFYSGFGFNYPGIGALGRALAAWQHKGDIGEGHSKPFIYWCQLLMRAEPWAVFGLLACLRYVVPPLPRPLRLVGAVLILLCLGVAAWELSPPEWFSAARSTQENWENAHVHPEAFHWGLGVLTVAGFCLGVSCLRFPAPGDWRVRLLAVYGPGTLLAYSIIHYKTPWCAISFEWPFFFTGGAFLVELTAWAWWPALAGGLALAAWSLALAVRLNYLAPTDDALPYVYVQTYPDVRKIVDPLLQLAERDPSEYTKLHGIILCGSTYPLPWLLGDFTHIGYYADDNSPLDFHGDFLLVVEPRVADTEKRLDAEYFREVVHLRPAQEPLTLYLRAPLFAPLFPGRKPEFHPSAHPVQGTPEPPTDVTPPADQ